MLYFKKDWASVLSAVEFTYNSAVSDNPGASPFELDLGWKPKSALEMLNSSESVNESLKQFKLSLVESSKDVQFSHKMSKAKQSAYDGQKSHPYF